MVTGIVSIAMTDRRANLVAVLLFWPAAIEYVLLLLADSWRITTYRVAFRACLADPVHAFGKSIFVAASNVLGTKIATDGHYFLAIPLIAVGAVTGLILVLLVARASITRTELPYSCGLWMGPDSYCSWRLNRSLSRRPQCNRSSITVATNWHS